MDSPLQATLFVAMTRMRKRSVLEVAGVGEGGDRKSFLWRGRPDLLFIAVCISQSVMLLAGGGGGAGVEVIAVGASKRGGSKRYIHAFSPSRSLEHRCPLRTRTPYAHKHYESYSLRVRERKLD